MHGNDRVRFCAACSKNVYNIAELSEAQASTLIGEAEGRTCVRFYRRRDGTVLTADCPVGLRSAVRRRVLRRATVGVMVALSLRSAVWFSTRNDRWTDLPPAPSRPGVTLADWADWAAMAIGVKQTPAPYRPRFGWTMGDFF